MRLLGIDFGFKRIGIAIGETLPPVTTARPPIAASGSLKMDAEALGLLARTEKVDRIVVGLPVEDGGEGRMARICRTVADLLAAQGFAVSLVDESLTSVEADANLRRIAPGQGARTAGKRKKLKDGEAARLILERFMHEQEIS